MAFLLIPSALPAQDDRPEPFDEATQKRSIPFDEQPYKIKVLISFSTDAQLSERLRGDVIRCFRSYVANMVGDAWQIDLQDVSGSLALSSEDSIVKLTDDRIDLFTVDQDKVFVLGIRSVGDRFLLASREFDVVFARWGPVFVGSAREPTQVARELLVLATRMFSPLAKLETGDAKRVSIKIKGGRLPALNPAAIDTTSKYKPAFQFVPNGTLFRPMRPEYNDDREIVGVVPMGWTFYEVERRSSSLASCRIVSALKNTLPPQAADLNDPELIVARTAGGNTRLRLVDKENKAPLAAMDIEVREIPDGASKPLGTTDADGRINIPPNSIRSGLVTVFVRHGRDVMAVLPILPGAGEEADLTLQPDAVRLDIEGRVMAVQTQIVDQVAERTILGGAKNPRDPGGALIGGLIRKAIDKKDWTQAQSFLKQFKESPTAEVMTAKLNQAKEYAKTQRPEEKWTGKIKRMFSETEQIIEEYFNPDEFGDMVDSFEDDLKAAMEDAATTAAEGQLEAAPAASGTSTPNSNSSKSGT